MLTWDEGQEDKAEIDGVSLFKICRLDAGVRGLRFVHPRWTGLCRAMGRANADIYYHNTAEYVTGQVAAWCRRHHRRFVYSVASDPDCDPMLPEMKTLRERVLYRHGLKWADRVIVQTERQRKMLEDGFGRPSVMIPMPCPGPSEAQYVKPLAPCPEAARIVWIGKIVEVKRPDLLLTLAEAMPEVTFDLVGPAVTPGYSEAVLRQAAGIPNVTVHGYVRRDEIPRLYKQASLLCSTSAYEGFPNTFLEAWSYGVPVVSTFDPGDLIRKHGLGTIASDPQGLIAGIRALIESPARWRAVSEKVRRYYVENHIVDSVMPAFEQVFADVCGGHAGSG